VHVALPKWPTNYIVLTSSEKLTFKSLLSKHIVDLF
jgi:hypothetical protein